MSNSVLELIIIYREILVWWKEALYRFNLYWLQDTRLNSSSRQDITSIKGCMSRCKRRVKGTNAVGHRDESKPKKKKAKSGTKRSSCKINEPAGVPSASRMKVTRPLNTFPALSVCMNRYTRRLDPASRSWIARRLASVRLSWDGTYDLSNVDTARLAPICTPRVPLPRSLSLSFCPPLLLSYPVSRYAFRFMGILRSENIQPMSFRDVEVKDFASVYTDRHTSLRRELQ